MAYGDFKDLARRTVSDKSLRDKAFNFVKNPKYDGYQQQTFVLVKTYWRRLEDVLKTSSV